MKKDKEQKLQDKQEKREKTRRNRVLKLEKSRRGFATVIFGRATLTVLLVLIEIALVMSFILYLEAMMSYYIGFRIVLSVMFEIVLLVRGGNPVFQVSWTIIIMLFPIAGGFLYLVFSLQLGSRRLRKRLKKIHERTEGFLKQREDVKKIFAEKYPDEKGLAEYLSTSCRFPVYPNANITYYDDANDKLHDILEAISCAHQFIFLEYFILEEGYMWGSILRLLEEKAREGVEVRVLYDGLCTVKLLPVNYYKRLEKIGIRARVFSPFVPAFTTSYNNRDHRKIIVVDGRVAFTGGINLADEYINLKKRFGMWKDAGVKIEGPAADTLTLAFLQMWDLAAKEESDYKKYIFKDPFYKNDNGKGFVQCYADEPFDNEQVAMRVYLDMINRAKSSIKIMTPYLVLDYETSEAIKFAAKRGVDVSIVVPHIPDKHLVFAVTRSNYDELIPAGVKIYEYTPGFLHAKILAVDGKFATVGTTNFDYRSYYLHFECGACLYDVPEISNIEEDFKKTILESTEIHVPSSRKYGFFYSIWVAILKVFAPLM